MKLKHLGLIDKVRMKYKTESYNYDWEEEDEKFMDQYRAVATIAYLYYINYLSTDKSNYLTKTVGEFSNNSWDSVHVSVIRLITDITITLGFFISGSYLCRRIIRFSVQNEISNSTPDL
jgi:hypothetical protein